MKATFTFLALIIFIFSGVSFAQIGKRKAPVWHYEFSAIGKSGYSKISVEKDTTIGGVIAQKLGGTTYQQIAQSTGSVTLEVKKAEPYYIGYGAKDTVYYWPFGFSAKPYILYNFAAKPGDTWKIGGRLPQGQNTRCDSIATVVVDSVGTSTISGVKLRYLSVHTLNSMGWLLKGRIYEYLGAYSTAGTFMLPYFRSCDTTVAYEPVFVRIRCYMDESFPLHNFSTKACEQETANSIYHTGTSSFQLSQEQKTIKLTFSTPFKGTLSIYNISGQEVFSQQVNQAEELNIQGNQWGAGIYFIKISEQQAKPYVAKIALP